MVSGAKGCKGVRADGSPCKGPAVLSSGYCWAHDPARAGARKQARAAGGKARGNIARAAKRVPAGLTPVLETLLQAVEDVQAGTLTPPQATAMASLSTAIVKLFTATELEARLAALEQAGGAGDRWRA